MKARGFKTSPLGFLNFEVTSRAYISSFIAKVFGGNWIRRFSLKDAFLAVFVALLTYIMNWFGDAFLTFQSVSKRSRSQCFEFVALLLSIPCFEISNRCFKFAYAINQRRLRRIGLNNARLGGYDFSVEFDQLGQVIASAPHNHEGLNDIRRALERAERAADFGNAICYGHENSACKAESHRLG